MNKKKALAMMLAAVMILCLSGCVMVKTSFDFKENGSVTVVDGVYYSQEYFDLIQQTPEEFFASLEEPVYEIQTVEANDTTYYGKENVNIFAAVEDMNIYKSMNEVPWEISTYEEDGRPVGSLSYVVSSEAAEDEGSEAPEAQEDVDLTGILLAKLEATFCGGVKSVSGLPEDAYTVSGNTVSVEVTAAEEDFVLTIEGYLDDRGEPIFQFECEFDSFMVDRTLSSVDYYLNNVAPEPRECFDKVDLHWYRRESGAPLNVDFEEISGDVPVKAGFEYALTIEASVKEGYYFTDDFSVVFNGLSSNDVPGLCSVNGNKVIIQYVFGEIAQKDPVPAEDPEEPEEPATPFTDVAEEDYFYDATVWAFNAKPQITDGNGKDKFMPEQICTRGQVVTFLWRALGQPAPAKTENPFEDVAKDDYFYEPVLWAFYNDTQVTDGTDAAHFSPGNPCRNSHILTFIYRAMGEPGKSEKPETWYTDAYNWARYDANLLEGTFTGTFDINGECPRKNVVQYLYTYYNMGE